MIELTTELSLPPFTMDCSEWIIAKPAPSAEPVLAALSTLLLDDDLHEASGTLSVCVLEDEAELAELGASPVVPEATALETADVEPGVRRFVMPAPVTSGRGPRLTLVAEFASPEHPELHARIETLMTSFCWA